MPVTHHRRLAVAGTGALAVVVLATGAATAATTRHDNHRDNRGGGQQQGQSRGELIHGSNVVENADGTFTTRESQKGAVTAVSPTSVSVTSDDGYAATYVVDSSTKVKDGTNDSINDITVGETVVVQAVKTATADTATSITVPEKKASASATPSATATS